MTRRCRVLLVDDQPMVRQSMARLLSVEFDVAEAGSLEAARVSLALARPDVLITDLDLGDGARGEDLLAEARAKYPEVERVVLSGSNPERLAAIGDLAAFVFQKGAAPFPLLDALRGLWRGRRDE